ncbi:MAG TPA: PP2C family protein-serine/threonine phosphatase [Terriglobales bacterium]|nr:PP2C family protein-serine/threonine phosphatase [Terriglobales bacterium]
MCVAVPEMRAGDVLTAFHRDAPYLFLGAAFVAVGLVAAAFAAIRRKHDSLLIYFALFAALYGLRLWIQSRLLGMTVPDSAFYTRLRSGIDYIVLIPAFLFFTALGLPRQFERAVGYAGVGIGCALAAANFSFGDSPYYHLINNIVVVAAFSFFLIRFMTDSSAQRSGPAAADFAVIRWGLLIFVAFVVWENIAGLLSVPPKVEPFGFAAFLCTLGYVAARRTLQRDQQLNEIQKELDVARRIQLSILPAEFPKSAHFRVAARYVPMTSVAGDFYDYIVADDHQAGLLIADVSGHGVPAALIASMVKLAAASQRALADEPSRFLSGMNSALFGNTQNQFVTAAYVHLNADSRELRYSAAGHPPMLLLRNGGVTEIEENGLILAAFDFASYSNATHHLEPGDRLLLYTDGIVDVSITSGDFFGQDRLRESLRETAGLSASAAADSIIASVREWSAKQEDDLTVLVCDYMPT